MSALANTRQKFLLGINTIPNIRQDFSSWHLGRTSYAVWAIDIDFAEVRRVLLTASSHLKEFLLEDYSRQPHITVSTCGFLTDHPDKSDDYDIACFESQVCALKQLSLKPFEIQLGSLSSFSLAPFFHVIDVGNHLLKLHQCLRVNNAIQDDVEYLPHVTVGLYSEMWHAEHVVNRLDSFFLLDASKILINRISLMTYQSAEIGGILTTVANFSLVDGQITWCRDNPLNC
jgi:2'-5' RNA ligase